MIATFTVGGEGVQVYGQLSRIDEDCGDWNFAETAADLLENSLST